MNVELASVKQNNAFKIKKSKTFKLKREEEFELPEMTLEAVKADIAKAFAKRGEAIDEEELLLRAKAWLSFNEMRAEIAKLNLPEMTLDDINAEIAEMRAERRAKG